MVSDKRAGRFRGKGVMVEPRDRKWKEVGRGGRRPRMVLDCGIKITRNSEWWLRPICPTTGVAEATQPNCISTKS